MTDYHPVTKEKAPHPVLKRISRGKVVLETDGWLCFKYLDCGEESMSAFADVSKGDIVMFGTHPDPLALLEACVSNKKDKLHPTCTWKGKRYAYNEVLRLIQQLRENPEAVRKQGIADGWWRDD